MHASACVEAEEIEFAEDGLAPSHEDNGDMQGQRVMVVFFAVLITMQVVRLATQRGSVIWWPAGRRKTL